MILTETFSAGDGLSRRLDGAPQRLTGARLTKLVRTAAAGAQWPGLVRYTEHERWYQRLARGDDHEVWLLAWLPGQRTGFHDHCGSAGAFTVVHGCLQERTVRPGAARPAARDLAAGGVRSFGPRHVHEVVNASTAPAVSVHAYSPPLAGMRRYELSQRGLVLAAVETAGERW
jgi:predicted metal-dependent enzyme (double-stranded beta helix superfamily)